MLNRIGRAIPLVALLFTPVTVCVAICWVAALYEPWLLWLLIPLSAIYIVDHWDTYLDLSPIRQIFQSKEN